MIEIKNIILILFIIFGFSFLLLTIYMLAYHIIYYDLWTIGLYILLCLLNMTTILQAVNLLMEKK